MNETLRGKDFENRRFNLRVGGTTREELNEEIRQSGVLVNAYAGDLLVGHDFKVLDEALDLELFRLSLEELGFNSTPTINEILTEALTQGLRICPPEVGPRLRVAYRDQAPEDKLHIGMTPICGSQINGGIFSLERRGTGLCLLEEHTGYLRGFRPTSEFVFVS